MNIIRLLSVLICLLNFTLQSSAQQGGQSYIRFTLYTGGDDLRNGQTVTVSLYPNPELGNYPQFLNVDMNQGRGSANNTSFYYDFPLGNGWKPTSFRAIKILHDGSGHNAFEGYDNWNLNRIRVVFVDPNASPRQTLLLDLAGQPLVRFTNDKRGQSWNLSPQNSPSSLGGNTSGNQNKRSMTDYDVGAIRMSQYNTVDDPLQTMLVKIKQAGTYQTMTTAQARRIVESFKGEDGRMSLAQACYPYVSDQAQFPTLVDLFGTRRGQFESTFGRATSTYSSSSQTTDGTVNTNSPTGGSATKTRVAEGQINGKYIRIRYGQLAVKGRDVWSTISPYGQLWRTGSNEATTITFDRDVIIGKSDAVPAGTYSLFTIPGSPNWTFILNKNNRLWGTQGYNPDDDVARYYEDARPHTYSDQLSFQVISDGIMLQWENVEVFMPIR